MMTTGGRMMRVLFALVCYAAVTVQAAVVSFDGPSPKVVNLGDVFSMTIVGSGFVSNLDGGGLDLSFNPAILEVQDVIFDTMSWDFFTDKGTTDNVAGTVTEIQFNQFSHPKTGTFDIVDIQFRAKGLGTSNLGLAEWDGNPFASGGEVVAIDNFPDLAAGSVQVIPEPNAAWLLLAGLAMLPLVRRLARTAA